MTNFNFNKGVKRVISAIENSWKNDYGYFSITDVTEDELRISLDSFKENRYELANVNKISTDVNLLPVIAEYFDMEKIKELTIWNCDTVCEKTFYEKFYNLKILDIKGKSFNPRIISKLQSLTELSLGLENDINEYSDCVCALKNLRVLKISNTSADEILDWIGNLRSLNKLKISRCKNIKTLPESVCRLKNLNSLIIWELKSFELPQNIGEMQSLELLSLYDNINFKTLPESICNLHSLKGIHLSYNKDFSFLPDNICKLKNLAILDINNSISMEYLPENIGSLQSLKELTLEGNSNLKTLPESVGCLKNLKILDLNNSNSIKKLPDNIANITTLECVNLVRTGITSIPEFGPSVDVFADNKRIVIIKMDGSYSYRSFLNDYFILLRNLIRYNNKARREGLLALEDELYYIEEGFFKDGMRLMNDGHEEFTIREILGILIKHENDFYRKKLMEIAMEGIICILKGEAEERLLFKLNLMIDIKDNPIDKAYEEFLKGNKDAFFDFNFSPFIIPEGEREEILFIKKALEISEISRKEGLLAIESCINKDAAAKRDVFEYGIHLLAEGYRDNDNISLGRIFIEDVLNKLIECEKDPVKRNIAVAKKEAVLSISAGCNSLILLKKLTAYFDKSIEDAFRKELSED